MLFLLKVLLLFVLVEIVVAVPLPVEGDGTVFRKNKTLKTANKTAIFTRFSGDTDTEDPQRYEYEEDPDLFQGDIVLDQEQQDLFFSSADPYDEEVIERTGILLEKMRWPKNTQGQVIMPYVFVAGDYSKKSYFCVDLNTCNNFFKQLHYN
jgi:hypothetical protein